MTDIMYAEQFTPLANASYGDTDGDGGSGTPTPPPGNTNSVYALTGAEVDAWSGGSDSVGGDFILRMEGTQVALVPVEDKDGDNLWVDAPNAQSSAIFASSPLTDIMYAESQFTPLANASYGDTDGDGVWYLNPSSGNTNSVYALTGAEVDAWSGGSDSVGGDFILRMENGGVALVPVEDKDGDNLWVDALNVSPITPASSTDMASAENQFTNQVITNAVYGDTDDSGVTGGGGTMPDWVKATDYVVTDDQNVDGNGNTVEFPVVEAVQQAGKFFILNGQEVQSFYKSDGSYFVGADFTAGVDASQIYVSNYVQAELDVFQLVQAV